MKDVQNFNNYINMPWFETRRYLDINMWTAEFLF